MKGVVARLGRACCGLLLLGAQGTLPLAAQEQTSEQALIERVRQMRGELERAQPQPDVSRGTEELIRQIQVIGQQLRTDAEGVVLSEEEVRSLVRDGLGVEVLKAETIEREGQQVYAVTVMSPPGDYNGAFMVRTLLVDSTTGGLLGELPHTPRAAAADLSPGAPAAGPDGSGLEIRRRTYR